MSFDESKHPRDGNGQFAPKGSSEYSDSVNERIRWAKDSGIELPLNNDGAINDTELQRLYAEKKDSGKMTPAEKIASVHIDFSKDNILPELNESELEKVGVKENKPILLKKSIFKRNEFYHKDAMIDTDKILGETLYGPSEVFHGKSDKDYYTFVKPLKVSMRNGKDEYGVVLIDVTNTNKNFEIVHWHWVNFDSLNSLRQKKKD